jgi:hypothetical protein
MGIQLDILANRGAPVLTPETSAFRAAAHAHFASVPRIVADVEPSAPPPPVEQGPKRRGKAKRTKARMPA